MTEGKGNNKKLTIGLLNPQGHVRWKNLQIAAHPDTGGQIVYIIELAKALEQQGCRMDIFTRYFKDPKWPGYTKEIENYSENLRIIRIKCGSRDKFINKEDLWSVLYEFSMGVKAFYEKEGYRPDVFSSHYGDAGLAAAMLKKEMRLPFIHTGHSLGGKKMDNLRLSRANFTEINSSYRFHLRVIAERISFRNASAIVASTEEEVERQYGHKVYKRCVRDEKKFNIIPPGIDPELFYSYTKKEKNIRLYNKAVARLNRVLSLYVAPNRIHMPFVFSAARLSAKKNPVGLLKAYANSETLQEHMNLLIVAGNVEDPLNSDNRSKFPENKWNIIDDIIRIIKKHELSGKVCFSPGFDHHSQIPYIYRYAARNRWIFINPALHEPFGLTIVEAMASGLPVVATKRGGPIDILQDNEFGILVEPTDIYSISGGLKKMLKAKVWGRYSAAGFDRVKEHYTWNCAAGDYIKLLNNVSKKAFKDEKDYDIPQYFTDYEKKDDTALLKDFRKRYYI